MFPLQITRSSPSIASFWAITRSEHESEEAAAALPEGASSKSVALAAPSAGWRLSTLVDPAETKSALVDDFLK
jgi:hypothetical protein